MGIEQHRHLSRPNSALMDNFLEGSQQEVRQVELRPTSSCNWPSTASSSHHAAAPSAPSPDHSFVTRHYDDQMALGKRPSTASLSLNLSSLSVGSSSLPSPLGVLHQDQTLNDGTSMQPRVQPTPHQFAYNPPLPTGTSPSIVEWNGLDPSTRSNSSELYYCASEPTVINAREERAGTFNLALSQNEDSTASKAPFGMPTFSRRTSLRESISSSQMHEPCRDLHHDFSLSSVAQNSTQLLDDVDLPRPDSSHHVASPLEGNVPYPLTCEGADVRSTAGSSSSLVFDPFVHPSHKVEPKSPKIESLGVPNPDSKPVVVTRGQTSNFVSKLYSMINDPRSARYIQWTQLGLGFVVSNVGEFSHEILGSHFKHSNFSSFVRQLNMYGFHKANRTPRAQRTAQNPNDQIWEFSHPQFLRGREDLLQKIKRKAVDNGDPATRPKIDLPSEVAYQLGRLSDEHQQMAQALQAERNKVDRLANFVKSLYGAFRNAFPDDKYPLPPFPSEVLEYPNGDNGIMGDASPTNSAEGANRPGTSSSLNIWNESGSVSAQSTAAYTVSPTSSPTTTDFPSHPLPPLGLRPPSSTRSSRRQSLPQVTIPAIPRLDDASLRSATGIPSPGAYDEGYDTYGSAGSSQPSFDNDGRPSRPKRQKMNRISIKTTELSSPGPSPLSATAPSFPFPGFTRSPSASTVQASTLPSSTPSSAIQMIPSESNFAGNLSSLPISVSYGTSSHGPSLHGNHFPAKEPARRLARARSDSAPHGIGLARAWQHNQSLIRVGGESNTSPSSPIPGCFIANHPPSDTTSITTPKYEGEPWITRSRSTSHFHTAVFPAPLAQKMSTSSMPSPSTLTTDTDEFRDPNASVPATSAGVDPESDYLSIRRLNA